MSEATSKRQGPGTPPPPGKTPLGPQICDHQKLLALADIVKVPNRRRERFCRDIEDAIALYAEERRRLSTAAVHREIESFDRSVMAALEALQQHQDWTALEVKLAAVGKAIPLSAEVVAILRDNCAASSVTFDEAVGCLDAKDPVAVEEALEVLAGACVVGFTLALGRKRPGGKQSRPRMKYEYAGPPAAEPCRPIDEVAYLLVDMVVAAYVRAKSRKPPRWGNSEKPGPFERLLAAVLELVDHRRAPASITSLMRQARGRDADAAFWKWLNRHPRRVPPRRSKEVAAAFRGRLLRRRAARAARRSS